MAEVKGRMKLWIDDERSAPEGWQRAKTAYEAIGCVESQEVTHVSFDHDLGEGNGNGHDVICVIERMVAEGRMKPPQMAVHSANPVGAARIQQAIDAIEGRYGGLQESG